LNKKAILVACIILGLAVFVPLVTATPLTQNHNGDTLQTQDQTQLHTRSHDMSCTQDGTKINCSQQNQTCIQDQQCLQARNWNSTETSEACNATQTQMRHNLCQQECSQTCIAEGQQNCNGNQQQFQHKNQAP
jgi:hypothetical protein